VDGARDEFLARARLARDEHGHVGGADFVYFFDQARHGGRRVDEARHETLAGEG
jgi:hypothetical protein